MKCYVRVADIQIHADVMYNKIVVYKMIVLYNKILFLFVHCCRIELFN